MGQPIQQCRSQLGITEHAGPFRKAQVSGDDHAGFFIQFADQMKQQCPTHLAERQIPQFIQNNEISMGKAVGQSPLLGVELFLFKRVDEFNGRQKSYAPVMMYDGLNADRGGKVRLAGTRPTNQYDIFGLIQEFTTVQCPDQCFADRTVLEYKPEQSAPDAESRATRPDICCSNQAFSAARSGNAGASCQRR